MWVTSLCHLAVWTALDTRWSLLHLQHAATRVDGNLMRIYASWARCSVLSCMAAHMSDEMGSVGWAGIAGSAGSGNEGTE